MTTQTTCKFCDVKTESCYKCPKCYSEYCSSRCYKHPKHSKCSEEFYKDQVMLELQSNPASSRARAETLEFLKRSSTSNQTEPDVESNFGCDDSDREESTWADRFSDINFDDVDAEALWDRLYDSEKEEFFACVRQNRVHEFLPTWMPWWTKQGYLIQEVGTPITKFAVDLANIPPLSTFLKNGKSSPLICYNILNILYAYAATCRMYEGVHHDLPIESSEMILQISDNLKKNYNYSNAAESVGAATQMLKSLYKVNAEFSKTILEDAIHLIRGPRKQKSPEFLEIALSDLVQLFAAARKELKKTEDKNMKCIGKQYEKKLLFLQSWIKEHHCSVLETLPSLVFLIQETKLVVVEELEQQQQASVQVRKGQAEHQKQQPMIQEIS